jgi:O-antigen/teichoic acid export membrane protein
MSDRGFAGRAVKGVAWVGSGQVIRQLIGFSTAIILARILFPEDYGIFGMAYVAMEIAQALTDFGVGSALIQKRERDPTVLVTCFWLNVCLGTVIAIALLALGPLLNGYFRQEQLSLLLIPLAINLLVGAAVVVPQALLTQELSFKKILIAQVAGSLLSCATAISLALAGAGVWALVIQPLAGNLCTGVLLFVFAKWLPKGKPVLSSISGILSFSTNLFFANISQVIARNLHPFILGRSLGSAPLGAYNMASGMTGMILYQVSTVVVRVLFPTMSHLNESPERFQSAWLKANSAIAMAGVPMSLGAMAIAPDLVPLVFGQQWTSAIALFQILSVGMAFQCVLTTSGTVLMSKGRTDLILRASIASIPLIGFGLFVGAKFSLEWAAVGYIVTNVIYYLALTVMACKASDLSIQKYISNLVPWVVASILMVAMVTFTISTLNETTPWIRLLIGIVSGVLFQILILLLLFKKQTRALFSDVVQNLK